MEGSALRLRPQPCPLGRHLEAQRLEQLLDVLLQKPGGRITRSPGIDLFLFVYPSLS